MKLKWKLFLGLILIILGIPFLFWFFQYLSKATPVKANILIDTKKINGTFPDRWKALAQGGEETGVRMLQNVVPQVAGLYPRYIRIDHIYDFYNVVSRSGDGSISLNWQKLDSTVCDIFHTGAKPFLVLGYMPEALSGDNSLISVPKKWDDWSYVVQKTIERYSGKYNQFCGNVKGALLQDIYYEVWNEPDLETFGKWSIYGGKDYRQLYYYSAIGAGRAQNVNNFFLGGPATTRPYQSWMQGFLRYVRDNKLRLDFISWHHYSKNIDDYADDIRNVNSWLATSEFTVFQNIPKIITEWGYDSEPNPIADTNVGAAHTIAAIRNFIDENYQMAFLFEIKDGPTPRWGILTQTGKPKPRYDALKLLNLLTGTELKVQGEGTFVRALASQNGNVVTSVLVNYDPQNNNNELVPVSFNNLDNGIYTLTLNYLSGQTVTFDNIEITNSQLQRNVLMVPNMVVAIQLQKK